MSRNPYSIDHVLEHFEQDGESATCVCCPRAGFAGFDGHFPNQPILPGVCQLSFVIEVINRVANEDRISVKSLSSIKFQNIIVPDTRFVLRVERTSRGWTYTISDGDVSYASGKVIV